MSDVFNEEWISAYFDGEVSPEEAARFEASLDQHPERAKALEELRQLRSSIQSLPTHRIPVRSGDKSFEHRVLSALPIAATAESQRPELSIHEDDASTTRSGNGTVHGGRSLLDSSSRPGDDLALSDAPIPSDTMEPFGVIQHWRFALGTVASVAALILISFILSPASLDPVDGPAVALHDGDRNIDVTNPGDGDSEEGDSEEGDDDEAFEAMSSGDAVSLDRIDDLESNSGMHKSDNRRSGFRPGREVRGEHLSENETADPYDELTRFESDGNRQLMADNPQDDPSSRSRDGNQNDNESLGTPDDHPNQDSRGGQPADFRQRISNGRYSDGSSGDDANDEGQTFGGGSPGGGGSREQNAGDSVAGVGGSSGDGPGSDGSGAGGSGAGGSGAGAPGASGPEVPGPGGRLESQQDRSGADDDADNPSRGGRDSSNQNDPRANGIQNNTGSQSATDADSNDGSDQSGARDPSGGGDQRGSVDEGGVVGGGFGGGGGQFADDVSPSSDVMDDRNEYSVPQERYLDDEHLERFYGRNGDFGFEFSYGDPFPLYRQLTEDRFNSADQERNSQFGRMVDPATPQHGFIAVAEIDPYRNRLYVDEIRGRRRSVDESVERVELDDAHEKRTEEDSTRALQDNQSTQRNRETRGSGGENTDRREINGYDDSRNNSGENRSDDGRGNEDGVRGRANAEEAPGTNLGGQSIVDSADRFGDTPVAPGNPGDGQVDFLFDSQLGLDTAIEASEALDDLMESVLKDNDILEGKTQTLDVSSEASDRDDRSIELARLRELNFQLETQTNWQIESESTRPRQRGWGLSEAETDFADSNSSDGETTTGDATTGDATTDATGIEESRAQETYYRDEFGRRVESKTAMLGNEFIVYQWYRIEADAAAVNGLIQDLDALGISVDMYYQHAFQPSVDQSFELSINNNDMALDARNDVGDSQGSTEGGEAGEEGDDADADPSTTRLPVQGNRSAPLALAEEERRQLGQQPLGPDDLALVPRTTLYEEYQQLSQVAPETQGQDESVGQDVQDGNASRDVREFNPDSIEQIESSQNRPNESDSGYGVGNADETNLNAHVTDLARGNYFERGSRVVRTNPIPIVSLHDSTVFFGGEEEPRSDDGYHRQSSDDPLNDEDSLADRQRRVGGDTASDSGDSADAAVGDDTGSAPPDDGQSSEGRQTGQRLEFEESTTEQKASGIEAGEKPFEFGSELYEGLAIAPQPLRHPNFVLPQFTRDGRVQLVIVLAHRHRPPVRIVAPSTVEQVAPDEQ